MTTAANRQASEYLSFAVTVDVAAFMMSGSRLQIALVERGNDPYQGRLALPGGFVEPDEDLPEAAVRELAEETGLAVAESGLRQVGAYGQPGRDPRMRVVTIVYWVDIESVVGLRGGSDAASAVLVPVDDVLADPGSLAFDHHQIIQDAVTRRSVDRDHADTERPRVDR